MNPSTVRTFLIIALVALGARYLLAPTQEIEVAPANCVYNLPNGVKMGIPCEYTPETWCAVNPCIGIDYGK